VPALAPADQWFQGDDPHRSHNEIIWRLNKNRPAPDERRETCDERGPQQDQQGDQRDSRELARGRGWRRHRATVAVEVREVCNGWRGFPAPGEDQLNDGGDVLSVFEDVADGAVRAFHGFLHSVGIADREDVPFLEDHPAGLGHLVDAIELHIVPARANLLPELLG
jgi:hypothetical protein